jgi:hypothetical protein
MTVSAPTADRPQDRPTGEGFGSPLFFAPTIRLRARLGLKLIGWRTFPRPRPIENDRLACIFTHVTGKNVRKPPFIGIL